MSSPEIIIISALAASNRVIGNNGKVPWHIPEDSQRFQRLTWGHPVVMGRKTWQDDIERCPLPYRHNLVVSRSLTELEVAPDCPQPFQLTLAHAIPDAIAKAQVSTQSVTKIFMVGGAGIYAAALPLADTLELTLVDGEYSGDTFFPAYESLIGTEFELETQDNHEGYRYVTYRRIRAIAA